MQTCLKNMKKKILTGRKVIKSSVHNLCGFRMSTKKMQSCKKNPENSYTEKNVKRKPSGYAQFSICSFDDTKNKRCFHRGKGYIEKFCKDLKELEEYIEQEKVKE